MEYKYLFDDQWFTSVWHTFSFLMITIPSIIAGVLKIIAIRHPNVPTDTIMELVKCVFKKPGDCAK